MARRGHRYNVNEGSINSSTGSNDPIIDDKELSDDISSNPHNQTVGDISKQSDEKPQIQQRGKFLGHNQEMGPYDSTAHRPNERMYTPGMICDALLQYKIDRGTTFKAYDHLTNDIKEVRLFFGLPLNLRMVWLMERMFGKEDTDVEKKTSNKKRNGRDVEEEASNMKRKNDCVFEPRKYTPRIIRDALSTYPFSRHAFFDALDLLMNNDKEVGLFFGLPPTLRMGWIMQRIPKMKDVEVRDASNKKRKGIDVEEEASNKRRKNDRY